MNRKLHNTASALMVPGTLLLLALVAQAQSEGTARPAAAAVQATAAADSAELPARPVGGRAGRVRHSVALPFFSFAPRG